MTIETAPSREKTLSPEYSHKSFELVFTKFCDQYRRKIEELSGPKARRAGQFLGLPGNASVQEMGHRLNEVIAAIIEPAHTEPEGSEDLSVKDAVLYSARHLAWSMTMAGLSSTYLERVDDYISRERHSGRNNIQRLFNDRKAAVDHKLVFNHSIRDFFNSELAHNLSNDSPEAMAKLMERAPYVSKTEKAGLVKGLSLEIAGKRKLDELAQGKYRAVYGSRSEDSVGGDLVIVGEADLIFMDLKSKMPEKFPDGTAATQQDYERGYRWIEGAGAGRQVVIWAYDSQPVAGDSFNLTDERLAANLEAVAASATIEKTSA